jgi:hypothetical protein
MTATELAKKWDARDSLYARRKALMDVLTNEEEVAVRAWRRMEVDELPVDEQSAALGTWSRWAPPAIRSR